MLQQTLTNLKVTELDPLGFGNAEASIRYEKVTDNAEQMNELKAAAIEIIKSGKCIVTASEADDGCIDGRIAVELTYVDNEGKTRTVMIEFDKNHERQKVAGGGYITALAMELAIHPPRVNAEVVLEKVIEVLANHGIYCGLHTGSYENNELGQTDCGANDKIENVLKSGLTFRNDITTNVEAIIKTAGGTFSESYQKEVYNGWFQALLEESFFKDSNGTSRATNVMKKIQDAQEVVKGEKPLSVSKKLVGDHNERFILVLFKEGQTFSQKKLHDELRARFPDLDENILPQVFVVDAPRIITLAMNISDEPNEQQIALQAGVSYQLATAATLTDGSLRVFAIS